jgi:peroxiredoxin
MSRQDNNIKIGLLLVVVAVIALSAGFALRQLIQDDVTTNARDDAYGSDASLIGQRRPDFSLPNLDAKVRSIDEWDGKVLLINFWATWCPPCKREIPGFIRVREQLGAENFEIIGIAIDNRDAVKTFADSLSIPYPILHGEQEASRISTDYGNRMGGLPYSVVVDRQGMIHSTKTGEFEASDLLQRLKPLL